MGPNPALGPCDLGQVAGLEFASRWRRGHPPLGRSGCSPAPRASDPQVYVWGRSREGWSSAPAPGLASGRTPGSASMGPLGCCTASLSLSGPEPVALDPGHTLSGRPGGPSRGSRTWSP